MQILSGLDKLLLGGIASTEVCLYAVFFLQ